MTENLKLYRRIKYNEKLRQLLGAKDHRSLVENIEYYLGCVQYDNPTSARSREARQDVRDDIKRFRLRANLRTLPLDVRANLRLVNGTKTFWERYNSKQDALRQIENRRLGVVIDFATHKRVRE